MSVKDYFSMDANIFPIYNVGLSGLSAKPTQGHRANAQKGVEKKAKRHFLFRLNPVTENRGASGL